MGNWNRLGRWDQIGHSYWTKPTLERSALDATRHEGYWMLQAPEILDDLKYQAYWMEKVPIIIGTKELK